MQPKLMGIKQGMMQWFDAEGNRVVCTVIAVEPHVVSQVKTSEQDGYAALQLASIELSPAKARKQTRPLQGHFKKAGVGPRRHLMEVRLDEGSPSLNPGDSVGLELFRDVSFVDVVGTSKGKGYQGVMKRHNFAGGPAAHGSGFHRHAGSTGMRSSPGRCLPGVKKAGRMGGERVTVEGLRVIRADVEKGVIIVAGAIPGARGGRVVIRASRKKQKK